MRRSRHRSIYIKIITLPRFFNHTRERTRSLNKSPSKRSYAFVEFRSRRDAEDAYYDMHGRYFEGSRLSIQWAKNPPSSVWRYDRRTPPPAQPSHRSGRDRERSRSPRRRSERDDRDRDRERDRDDRDRKRRSRSPDRRRSPTPRRDDRRRDERERDRDRARTPPIENDKKEDDKDRAQTPPHPHDH